MTQAGSPETVRGAELPSERNSPPPTAKRIASLLKQVLGRRVYAALARGWGLPQRGPLIYELMTGTAVYEIRRARSREELAAALELRHDVFCVEQGVPERDEVDGRDPEGIHLVAVRDGEMLATCRILLVGTTAQFSRLAVRRSARRQGIATAMLAAADEESRAGGVRRIVLHAQTYARELYELAGYRPRGRVFWEAGIEHIAMEKVLD